MDQNIENDKIHVILTKILVECDRKIGSDDFDVKKVNESFKNALSLVYILPSNYNSVKPEIVKLIK